MGLLLLEAFGALVLLLLIVWWTMFSGRTRGELPTPPPAPPQPANKPDGADEATGADKT